MYVCTRDVPIPPSSPPLYVVEKHGGGAPIVHPITPLRHFVYPAHYYYILLFPTSPLFFSSSLQRHFLAPNFTYIIFPHRTSVIETISVNVFIVVSDFSHKSDKIYIDIFISKEFWQKYSLIFTFVEKNRVY